MTGWQPSQFIGQPLINVLIISIHFKYKLGLECLLVGLTRDIPIYTVASSDAPINQKILEINLLAKFSNQ